MLAKNVIIKIYRVNSTRVTDLLVGGLTNTLLKFQPIPETITCRIKTMYYSLIKFNIHYTYN